MEILVPIALLILFVILPLVGNLTKGRALKEAKAKEQQLSSTVSDLTKRLSASETNAATLNKQMVALKTRVESSEGYAAYLNDFSSKFHHEANWRLEEILKRIREQGKPGIEDYCARRIRFIKDLAKVLPARDIAATVRESAATNPTDVVEVISTFITENYSTVERFEFEREKLGSLLAHANPSHLEIVVKNLVGNAIQSAKEVAKGEVSVRLERHGNELVFRVINDGHPIPPEIRQKLFQLGTTHRLRPEGQRNLGYGLYISKQIIDGLGGRLDQDYRERTTSFLKRKVPVVQFTCRLPLLKPGLTDA